MGGRIGSHYVWAQRIKPFKRHAKDEHLAALARGELKGAKKVRLERHLDECVDCFQRYNRLLDQQVNDASRT